MKESKIRLWWDFSRLRDAIYKIKYFFQRLFRGYSDPEIFSVYHYIAKFVYPRLKKFTNGKRMGVPCAMFPTPDKSHTDEEHEEADKNWQDILNKMLFAFEWILYDDFELSKKEMEEFEKKYGNIHEEKEEYKSKIDILDGDFYFNMELYDKLNEDCQEGLELFGKYFRNLWD